MIHEVGRFSFSNQFAAMKIVGAVEKKENVISSVFWIYIDSFNDKKFVKMAFNIIEFRTFTHMINLFFKDPTLEFTKNSGGKTAFNTLCFKLNDSDPKEHKAVFSLTNDKVSLSVSILHHETIGLSKEMDFLANTCAEACYTAQKNIIEKRLLKKRG